MKNKILTFSFVLFSTLALNGCIGGGGGGVGLGARGGQGFGHVPVCVPDRPCPARPRAGARPRARSRSRTAGRARERGPARSVWLPLDAFPEQAGQADRAEQTGHEGAEQN